MRTAIYVYKPTTITLKPLRKEDQNAVIRSFRGEEVGSAMSLAPITLQRGIYQILSVGEVLVAGSDLEIQTSLRDKDEWPEPPQLALALEKGATAKTIKDFFSIAKDIEL
jgi:hypothetical protein